MPSTRFVILHHCHADGEHWDLMIEQDSALATWQLAHNPLAGDPRAISAVRLDDHRKAYLEYEGPLSGDRGHVTRIERGRYRILQDQPALLRFHLDGEHLVGTFELATNDDKRGTFRPVPDSP